MEDEGGRKDGCIWLTVWWWLSRSFSRTKDDRPQLRVMPVLALDCCAKQLLEVTIIDGVGVLESRVFCNLSDVLYRESVLPASVASPHGTLQTTSTSLTHPAPARIRHHSFRTRQDGPGGVSENV